MHPYYKKNKAKFRKELNRFLRLISKELEGVTGRGYPLLLNEIWNYFDKVILECLPYIGDNRNSGRQNLTGAYYFVAMGEVCRTSYGMTMEEWGRLTTQCYQRYFKQIPNGIKKMVGKILSKPRLANNLLRIKASKTASNAAKNPGGFETEVQPPTEEYPVRYHILVCPLADFAKEEGYMEYMPYLCNLDYVMFAELGLPFYREKTCASGDDCCDYKLKAGAPVNSVWPCHALTPGDPLK